MIDHLKRANVMFNGNIYELCGGHLVHQTADLIPLTDKRRRVKGVSWSLIEYVEETQNKGEEKELLSISCKDAIDTHFDHVADVSKTIEEGVILCHKCNDHLIANDGAICEICASTQDSIIEELLQKVMAHKYPDKKPSTDGYHIVWERFEKRLAAVTWYSTISGFSSYRDPGGSLMKVRDRDVSYWLELPEFTDEDVHDTYKKQVKNEQE